MLHQEITKRRDRYYNDGDDDEDYIPSEQPTVAISPQYHEKWLALSNLQLRGHILPESTTSIKFFGGLLRLYLENPTDFRELKPVFDFGEGESLLMDAYKIAREIDQIDPDKGKVPELVEKNTKVTTGIKWAYQKNGNLLVLFSLNEGDTPYTFVLKKDYVDSTSITEIIKKIIQTAKTYFPGYLDVSKVKEHLEKIVHLQPENLTLPAVTTSYFTRFITISNDLFQLINHLNKSKAKSIFEKNAGKIISINQNDDSFLINKQKEIGALRNPDLVAIDHALMSIQSNLLLTFRFFNKGYNNKAALRLVESIKQFTQKLEQLEAVAGLQEHRFNVQDFLLHFTSDKEFNQKLADIFPKFNAAASEEMTRKLFIVFEELFTNAKKYSPATDDDFENIMNLEIKPEDNKLVIELSNRAISDETKIEYQEAEKLFSNQVRGAKTKDIVQGTGTGLALAREIVAGYSGEITFIEPKNGFDFTMLVELPLHLFDVPTLT